MIHKSKVLDIISLLYLHDPVILVSLLPGKIFQTGIFTYYSFLLKSYNYPWKELKLLSLPKECLFRILKRLLGFCCILYNLNKPQSMTT